MTGILPVKKYGTQSALNMFDEYSMTDPAGLTEYVGFTRQEVFIPNKEVEQEFKNAVEGNGWDKEKRYGKALEDYHGNLLLVGINYDTLFK